MGLQVFVQNWNLKVQSSSSAKKEDFNSDMGKHNKYPLTNIKNISSTHAQVIYEGR